DEEIYNIFDTEKLLRRKPSVMIGKTSGLSGIAYWINENYELPPSMQVDKKDPLVTALKEFIDREYEGGRQTTLSTVELEEKIEELSGGRLRKL
ncbi:MAG: 2-isopropylmalate synthase, partial [Clostridia bacterium]|nr:2-isopropylmalate synthase [Clostridia bacterium]